MLFGSSASEKLGHSPIVSGLIDALIEDVGRDRHHKTKNV
jgi:hypothetical protein